MTAQKKHERMTILLETMPRSDPRRAEIQRILWGAEQNAWDTLGVSVGPEFH